MRKKKERISWLAFSPIHTITPYSFLVTRKTNENVNQPPSQEGFVQTNFLKVFFLRPYKRKVGGQNVKRTNDMIFIWDVREHTTQSNPLFFLFPFFSEEEVVTLQKSSILIYFFAFCYSPLLDFFLFILRFVPFLSNHEIGKLSSRLAFSAPLFHFHSCDFSLTARSQQENKHIP